MAAWFKSSALEFRIRYWIHAVLIALGFWAPWGYLQPAGTTEIASANTHTWGVLAAVLAKNVLGTGNPNSIVTAFNILLSCAIVFAVAAALLRTWAAAYLDTAIVESPAMHTAALSPNGILEDGPYRHLRNPLYLGTMLHVVALALLMSRSGAIFTLVTIGILQVRLILGEEAFLSRSLGAPYLAYVAKVPRLLPSIVPRIRAAGSSPRWLQALLGEIYFWGVALSFAFLGWAYATPRLIQAVLISFGIALLVRAFTPRQPSNKQP